MRNLATDPKVVVDPYDEAGKAGVEIADLTQVRVAFLGSEAYDLRTVAYRSLRLGDDYGALGFPVRRTFDDVDHDGVRDWVVLFDMSRRPFNTRANTRRIAWVKGTLIRPDQPWYDMQVVFQLGSDSEKCAFVFNETLPGADTDPIAYRCVYYTSFANETTANLAPLNITNLVAAINADAQTAMYTTRIQTDSVVVIEAYAATGGHGRANNSANGGSGGSAGYAIVNNTVAFFETLPPLNLYVGEPACVSNNGAGGGGGGGSTAVSSQPFDTINVPTGVTDPTQYGILLIAGGGGGGGNGYERESTHHTGEGGGGGARIPDGSTVNLTFSQGANGSREAASSSYGGGGGAISGQQTGIGGSGGGGESAHGGSGSNGIGGVGGFDGSTNCPALTTMWQDTKFAINQSPFGKGGNAGYQKGSQGGFGGGGFGSGGGGASGYLVEAFKTSNGSAGGGGGGSFADRSKLAASNAIVQPLIVGPSGASLPSVVITYEMQ